MQFFLLSLFLQCIQMYQILPFDKLALARPWGILTSGVTFESIMSSQNYKSIWIICITWEFEDELFEGFVSLLYSKLIDLSVVSHTSSL